MKSLIIPLLMYALRGVAATETSAQPSSSKNRSRSECRHVVWDAAYPISTTMASGAAPT
jgi:hypothetical protein